MIVDLFAGPGGWDVAAHELGLDPIGIEYETWACKTRAAAGFTSIQADVSTIDPARFAGLDGLIASPPCQGFSMAGKGAARNVIPELAASIRARRWDDRVDPDPRVWLIVDMGRWLEQLDPTWIALEQVPGVMPLWRCYADLLRDRGYSVWTGLLNAADFGVPQTRTRAILMAARGRVVHPPEPTHAREPVDSLFGTLERWVTMAEALGWGMTARPCVTLMAGGGRGGGPDPLDGGSGARAILAGERGAGRFVRVGFPRLDDRGTSEDGYRDRDWRSADEPSFAVTKRARSWVVDTEQDDEFDELGWGVLGDDWVVSTGMNTMSVSRDPQDMEPYERPITEPAPTLGTMAGGQWSVGPPGHRTPPMRWKDDGEDRFELNTGRAWAEGGSREDAQVVDVSAEPAPALTAKSGGQWQIRNTGRDRATVRDGDEPAPTLAFGHTSSEWVFERPSTTIQGDARAFSPGGHIANDGRDNSKMVGRSENAIRLTVQDALILQSFDPDFPVQGTKTRQFEQIGNAIPALLAWHILRALTG